MKTNRTIYLVYFIILVSAIFYRTVKADSSTIKHGNTLNKITLNQVKDGTDIVMGLSSRIRPESFFFSKENSVVLDFYDTLPLKGLSDAFTGEMLKLGYVMVTNGRTRVKLYAKDKSKISLSYLNNDVVVKIRQKKAISSSKAVSEKNTSKDGVLVHPSEKKFSQAVLNLKDSSFEAVVTELANEAEIELLLGDEIPERISANFETSTPFEALRNIAYENNLKFYQNGKVWCMSGV